MYILSVYREKGIQYKSKEKSNYMKCASIT